MKTLEQEIAAIRRELELSRQQEGKQKAPDEPRRGSRFVGPNADVSLVEHVASGGTIKTAEPVTARAERGAKGLGAVFSQALDAKALSLGTGSSGGFLVPIEYSDEVVRLIRAKSAVAALGPRVVPVKKSLSVVSISTGATAYYTAENARITPSEQTFAEGALLTPKTLAALVPISTRLLRDASESPDVEEVIREDLAEIIALREDLAFLQGTGGTEPLGVRNQTGLTAAPSLGANGAAPSFDSLKDLVANLRAANAPFQKPGWIVSPRTINSLEKVKDTTNRYLADAGLLTFDATGGGGTLLGYPFRTSTQIPTTLTTGTSSDTSYIIFGSDWTEAWIGEEQDLEIEASAEASYTADGGTTWISAWQNQQVLFRASLTHDFALRRPSLFSVMTGVRP